MYDQADIFLVPLLDGHYALGQVFEVTGAAADAPLCGLTGLRQPRDTESRPRGRGRGLRSSLLHTGVSRPDAAVLTP